MLTKFKDKFDKVLILFAKPLIELGVPPNAVTILGLSTAWIYLIVALTKPHLFDFALPVLFILSALMDGIDGVIARVEKKESRRGAFLDSVIDRVVDSIYVISLYFLEILTVEESFILLVGNLMISYTRAKAESLDLSLVAIGFAERAERTIITLVILIAYVLKLPSFILLSLKMVYIAAVCITFLYRVYYAYAHLR
mgnify:CR=1 FL=1